MQSQQQGRPALQKPWVKRTASCIMALESFCHPDIICLSVCLCPPGLIVGISLTDANAAYSVGARLLRYALRVLTYQLLISIPE